MIGGCFYGKIKREGKDIELENEGCICNNFDFEKGVVQIQLDNLELPEAFMWSIVPISSVVFFLGSHSFDILRQIIDYKEANCAIN